MQSLNAELVAQVSGLRRKRPRSEPLERLERQLLLPFFKIVKASSAQPENDATDEVSPRRPGVAENILDALAERPTERLASSESAICPEPWPK